MGRTMDRFRPANTTPLRDLSGPVSAIDYADQNASVHGGTARDRADMQFFGKQQRFKRNFGLISITGLTCSMMLTWEGALVGIGPQLVNGGPTGLFAGFLVGWFITFLQCLVSAEMASMIPLSGGQYNWVAILAPPKYRNFLSYVVGWLTVIAWQAAAAAVTYIASDLIQYLAYINYQFEPKNWQVTLIFYAMVFTALFVNIFFRSLLPRFEVIVLVLHVVGFFIILITIVYLSPHNSGSDVFDNFINGGNWSSNGLSFFVGLVASLGSFLGVDSASHLSEEITGASAVVPKAMIATMIINGSTGVGLLVAFLFTMGSALDAIESKGLPFVDLLLKATGSISGATGLAVIPLIILVCGAMGILATSSRVIWAFSRERGMPGSRYLSQVTTKSALPIYSILLSVLIQLILATINVGSDIAFNAFIGLTVESFYSIFIISAGVMLHRRLTVNNQDIRWGYFRLYGAGVPITILAIAVSLIGFFFSFWPPVPNPTAKQFNWAIVVYLSACLIAGLWWVISARKHYTGPVIEDTTYHDVVESEQKP